MTREVTIRRRTHGTGPVPPLGTPVPTPLLEFLHQAYPEWDYQNTSAHGALAQGYAAAEVTERVSREVRAACGVERPFMFPDARFLCYRVFFPVDRDALQAPAHPERMHPTGGFLDRVRGKGRQDVKAPGSRPILGDLWICSLGPYATFSQAMSVLDPSSRFYEEGRRLRFAVSETLTRNGVELIPWEVLNIAILDMRGTPAGKERSTPTVYDCLFERLP